MALSATKRGPHRQGTPLPGEVIMSDAGAGTSQGGGSQGGGYTKRWQNGTMAMGAKLQPPRFVSPCAISNQG
ncbi:hypothetical protein Bca4012_045289 [Brassica carinata]